MLLRRIALFTIVAASLAVGCKPRTDHDTSAVKDDEVPPEFRGAGSYPLWAYDSGPDANSQLGNDLINLNAKIPYFPGLSMAIYGEQMFRPAFGPIPWRMMQKPNSVKILFIGQDGTHIAEAAGRPATAGFGGRAQDLASYFGVGSSAAFINTYAYTIRWQYNLFDAPFMMGPPGQEKLSFGSLTTNPVWLLTQDQDSPMVQWRNNLINWIIRNNKDSLKMIVLFGGAARDAMGSYVISNGGTVESRFAAGDLAKIKVPEFEYHSAGGNKQAISPVDRNGKDLLKEFNGGVEPRYSDPAAMKTLLTRFRDAVNAAPQDWMRKFVFTKGGTGGSGILHPAQLGGYDIDEKMKINGAKTISLKGLRLPGGVTIEHDLLVAQLPHPTALSMMTPQAASQAVGKGLRAFGPYKEAGWKIDADPGFTNRYHDGQEYRYARGDMGPEYYDFGAPNSRMVNVSSASRSGADTIIFGTRDAPRFDTAKLRAMAAARPAKMPPDNESWIGRPTSTDGSRNPSATNRRYTYDPGPGVEMAKIMKTSLPTDAAFRQKREVNGDFGHYRGTFKDPRVLLVVDPAGEDDLISSRALTGSRGQYLHSLMEGMGVGDRYLIIKTAPYSMDANWNETLEMTKAYRQAVLTKVMETTRPAMIITDGAAAAAEVARILPSAPVPVINIARGAPDDASGIAEALAAIKNVAGFSEARFNGKMSDIPRSHLTYYARVWEGTSGDRVITATDARYAGKAFAFNAPRWAYKQRYAMPPSEIEGCEKLHAKVAAGKVRIGREKIPAMLRRLESNTPVESPCRALTAASEDILEVALPEAPPEPVADPQGVMPQ